MRLENCEISGVGAWSTAPLVREEPEADWVTAKENGIIPPSLFSLYARANYLSFGASPSFFRDKNHYLFSYFAMMLRSVKGSLVDADQEFGAFVVAQSQVYDPGKKHRGESWDASADDRARKHFRLIMLSLCASLDGVAELTALLLTDSIKGLRVGKSDFQDIENWLKNPPPTTAGVVTPQQIKLREFYDQLQPIVEAQGPEKDWLPLAKLLRNKAAHLGTGHFREMGFHDKNLVFYAFLPRQWPLIWEKDIKVGSTQNMSAPPPTLNHIFASLMQQDKVSYLRGLLAKVTSLVDAAVGVLDRAYKEFQGFQPNESALKQLESSFKRFDFEEFPQSN